MSNTPQNGDAQAPQMSGNLAAEMFIAEATDIRDLLSHYEANMTQLKEEIGAFVHREINEQATFSHLRAAVDQAELSSLRDTRFLEYIARREAEEKEVARSKLASGAAVNDAGELQSSPGWWQCMANSTSSALADWAPDAALSLTAFRNIAETWLGWKQQNAAAQADLDRAVEAVYSRSNEDVAYCCFGNGALFTGLIEEDGAALQRLETMATQIVNAAAVTADGEDNLVAGALGGYTSAVALAVAMTRSRFRAVMGSGAAGVVSGNDRNRLPLTGDAWDTLAFVRPERLQHTLVLRNFFFGGKLALVEQLGAEVDMVPLFFREDGDVTEGDAQRQRVHRLLAQTMTTLHDSIRQALGGPGQSSHTLMPSNAALTVAIQIPRSSNATVGGVLLDIHPLTPQLPFDGRVSWMDVCAVGRQRAGSSTSSCAATGGEAETATVLFRLTHLRVAALQPCDMLSRRLFPLLNAHLRGRPIVRRDDAIAAQDKFKAASPSHDARSSAWPPSSSAVLCLGAAACLVVAVYSATRWGPFA